MATPTKAIGGLSLLRAKIPSPKKTGNALVDSDTESKIQMLRELASFALGDLSHVPALYAKLRERMLSQQEVAKNTGEGFKNFGQLRQLDQEFLVAIIAARSDLSVDQIVAATAQDADAPQQMIGFLSQFPPNLRLPKGCELREVTFRLLNARAIAMGDRMKKFSASGGLDATTGRIDWIAGCYRLQFASDTGRLDVVKHCSGDVAKILAAVQLFKATAVLLENWSDMTAAIHVHPYPLVKLFSFFDKGKGPRKYLQFSRKIKELEDMVRTFEENLKAEQARASSAAAATGSTEVIAGVKLSELSKKKRAESCSKAREKANQALSAKLERKKIKLG